MSRVCNPRGGAGFRSRLNEALGKHSQHIYCIETTQNHETVVIYMNLQVIKLKRWLLSCDE